MRCRHCQQELQHQFLDLGNAPPSNAYLSASDLNNPEIYYPLKIFVCEMCWLVQTEDFTKAEQLFDAEYAYFSSISSGWLAHATRYAEMIQERLNLNSCSYVVEIAANDGYLLRNFIQVGIPCLGIEPTASTANAAEALGIPILRTFFTHALAKQLADDGKLADLVIGNNVYAHVPDINDFTAGLKAVLKPAGTITLEFPHLLRMIQFNQFDTAYHEHFSYLSLYTVCSIFEKKCLRIFDVEELQTHGGSLRIYACHAEDQRKTQQSIEQVIENEIAAGLHKIETYITFQAKAQEIKNALLAFLIEQKRQGIKVVGYGAAAKGNTLLNYAGIKADLLPFICDAAPSKQGKYMPGSHIPIVHPDRLYGHKPDRVLILPWNIKEEIMAQLDFIGEWGGQFLVAIPALTVY